MDRLRRSFKKSKPFQLPVDFDVGKILAGVDHRFEYMFDKIVNFVLKFYHSKIVIENIERGEIFKIDAREFHKSVYKMIKKAHKGDERPHESFMARAYADASKQMKDRGFEVFESPDRKFILIRVSREHGLGKTYCPNPGCKCDPCECGDDCECGLAVPCSGENCECTDCDGSCVKKCNAVGCECDDCDCNDCEGDCCPKKCNASGCECNDCNCNDCEGDCCPKPACICDKCECDGCDGSCCEGDCCANGSCPCEETPEVPEVPETPETNESSA